MSTTATPLQASTGNNKPLWIAIGVLAAAVMTLGGTLLYQAGQQSPHAVEPPAAAMPTPATAAPAPLATPADRPATVPAPAQALAEAPAPASERQPSPAKPAAASHTKTAARTNTPHPAAAPAPAPVPAPAPAGAATPSAGAQPAPVHPVCRTCGRVESVVPVERAGQGTGLGAVGGGVLGAIVGNQIGGGNGKTAATILGAIGGGVLGNTVEKRVRKQVAYEIGVRMEDGSYRTVERAVSLPVGTEVTLEGHTLRTADGVTVPAVPATPPSAAPAPEPVYTGG